MEDVSLLDIMYPMSHEIERVLTPSWLCVRANMCRSLAICLKASANGFIVLHLCLHVRLPHLKACD